VEAEIWLDVTETDPKDLPEVEKRFLEWYATGAEPRYNKQCFSFLTVLDKPFRYQVDFGQADLIEAIQKLHGKLYRLGVRVFVHFMH
jgi:predicted nucleotidyltransferase